MSLPSDTVLFILLNILFGGLYYFQKRYTCVLKESYYSRQVAQEVVTYKTDFWGQKQE